MTTLLKDKTFKQEVYECDRCGKVNESSWDVHGVYAPLEFHFLSSRVKNPTMHFCRKTCALAVYQAVQAFLATENPSK